MYDSATKARWEPCINELRWNLMERVHVCWFQCPEWQCHDLCMQDVSSWSMVHHDVQHITDRTLVTPFTMPILVLLGSRLFIILPLSTSFYFSFLIQNYISLLATNYLLALKISCLLDNIQLRPLESISLPYQAINVAFVLEHLLSDFITPCPPLCGLDKETFVDMAHLSSLTKIVLICVWLCVHLSIWPCPLVEWGSLDS